MLLVLLSFGVFFVICNVLGLVRQTSRRLIFHRLSDLSVLRFAGTFGQNPYQEIGTHTFPIDYRDSAISGPFDLQDFTVWLLYCFIAEVIVTNCPICSCPCLGSLGASAIYLSNLEATWLRLRVSYCGTSGYSTLRITTAGYPAWPFRPALHCSKSRSSIIALVCLTV